MIKFKVNNKVRYIGKYTLLHNHIGKVVHIGYSIENVILSVNWESFNSGHKCGGIINSNKDSGWNVLAYEVELINNDWDL